jgi:hypothetical protein
MSSGDLTVETDAHIDDPEIPWQKLRAFAPGSGWLCFQSHRVDVEQGALPEPKPHWGLLLSAECFDPDTGHSLHLRQNGRGGWSLSYYQPGDGDHYLYDEVTLVSHQNNLKRKPKRLHYRRYWQMDPQRGPLPVAACFIGYSD